MQTAIDYIIILGLKIHQNLRAELKYFLYKIKKKKFNSLVSS